MLSPPTCVGLRYGLLALYLEAFLGGMGSTTSDDNVTASRLSLNGVPDLPETPAYTLAPTIPTVGWPTLPRHPIARSNRYGNINPFPIDYAFLPRLRDRLTLGRLPLPRKPWAYGERVSHSFYRYSCQHNHFSSVQHCSRNAFIPQENAPLPIARNAIPKLRRHA